MTSQKYATLPESICRTCGDKVRAGSGESDGLRTVDERGTVVLLAEADRPGGGRVTDPPHAWTRTCARCAGMTDAEIVGEVTGLDDTTTRDVLAITHPVTAERTLTMVIDGLRVPHVTAETLTERTGSRWAHLSAEDRREIRAQVIRWRPRTGLHEDTEGRGSCALCGAQRAERWLDDAEPLNWDDGSPAALCGPCGSVWKRRGRPGRGASRRLAAVGIEASTGLSFLGLDETDDAERFRCYIQVPDASPDEGYAEPWAYSPNVADFREETWTAHPSLAPETDRERFESLRAARDAENAAQRSAQAIPAWTLA
ncbi:hypothetical protein [Microbacterium karelineae]|uniref:hypothetical protein n=1 Tax=Microbacterium karelineae TaxID=2654283 RepID=UPI0012EAA9F1|nr:hypothetical protein [Microbacterium karelineae]